MGGRVALEAAPHRAGAAYASGLDGHWVSAREAGEAEKWWALVDLAYNEGLAALAAQWLPSTLYPPRKVCRATPEIHEKHVRALMTRPDAAPVLPMMICPTLAVAGRFDSGAPYETTC